MILLTVWMVARGSAKKGSWACRRRPGGPASTPQRRAGKGSARGGTDRDWTVQLAGAQTMRSL